MKDIRYANRGQGLENFMKFANERYKQKGEAFIHKNATEFIPIRNGMGRIVNVKVEEKATVDFLGRYKHYPVAIEAKNSNEGSIRWDAVQPNQADDMEDFCREPGTIGLVVVSFNLERFFAIPWEVWSQAYEIRVRKNDRKTDVTITTEGRTWVVPKKYSVKPEELDPAWEVDGRNFKYGLHYLEKAENYVKSA